MSSSLRSLRENVGQALHSLQEVMANASDSPSELACHSDSSVPKVMPSHVGGLFISTDNLINRGNMVISLKAFDL